MAEGDTHGSEEAAMDGARAELVKGALVIGCRVPTVRVEAVARVALVLPRHQRITRDLGDDRGGGNRGDERVAVDYRSVPIVRQRERVDQEHLGLHLEALNGSTHRKLARRSEAVLVDVLVRHRADGPQAIVTDQCGEAVSLQLVEHLAVTQVGPPCTWPAGVEDDGTGHHGPGEWATADLIDTGDETIPLLPRSYFGVECGRGAQGAHRGDANAVPAALQIRQWLCP